MRVEHEPPAVNRPDDPEVLAGRALRDLRIKRGWTQEYVGRRMKERLGYDFHQTMVAKVESAARPLRVRELAEFAALFEVSIGRLVYEPTDGLSAAELEAKLAEVAAERRALAQRAAQCDKQVADAQRALTEAEYAHHVAQADLAVTDQRLAYLMAQVSADNSWRTSR